MKIGINVSDLSLFTYAAPNERMSSICNVLISKMFNIYISFGFKIALLLAAKYQVRSRKRAFEIPRRSCRRLKTDLRP